LPVSGTSRCSNGMSPSFSACDEASPVSPGGLKWQHNAPEQDKAMSSKLCLVRLRKMKQLVLDHHADY
jgi:hypothetical protein